MAFWKKSEDPWDIDPEKKRRETVSCFETEEPADEEETPKESFFSGLFKKKEEAAEEDAPVPCPYCGKPMTKGYLKGGRDQVNWTKSKPGFFGSLDENWLISNEGGLFTAAYRTSYMCEPCRKLIVDVPEPQVTYSAWNYDTPGLQTEQEEEKEK